MQATDNPAPIGYVQGHNTVVAPETVDETMDGPQDEPAQPVNEAIDHAEDETRDGIGGGIGNETMHGTVEEPVNEPPRTPVSRTPQPRERSRPYLRYLLRRRRHRNTLYTSVRRRHIGTATLRRRGRRRNPFHTGSGEDALEMPHSSEPSTSSHREETVGLAAHGDPRDWLYFVKCAKEQVGYITFRAT